MPPSFQVTPKTFSHVTGQPELGDTQLPPLQAAACAVELCLALPDGRKTAVFLGCLAHTHVN